MNKCIHQHSKSQRTITLKMARLSERRITRDEEAKKKKAKLLLNERFGFSFTAPMIPIACIKKDKFTESHHARLCCFMLQHTAKIHSNTAVRHVDEHRHRIVVGIGIQLRNPNEIGDAHQDQYHTTDDHGDLQTRRDTHRFRFSLSQLASRRFGPRLNRLSCCVPAASARNIITVCIGRSMCGSLLIGRSFRYA
jgi:hypothetical protein